MTNQHCKVGLRGELIDSPDGRNALSIPPAGIPGAIPFAVTGDWPAGKDFPAWTDIIVGEGTRAVNTRINPGLVAPPYWRLCDCLWFAYLRADELPPPPSRDWAVETFPSKPHPDAQDFAFKVRNLRVTRVVLVDSMQRLRRFEVTREDDQKGE
jgi:hypothetical protein